MKRLSILLLLPIFLGGCADPVQCEHDASDQVVDDQYCYDRVPGYEWESIYED